MSCNHNPNAILRFEQLEDSRVVSGGTGSYDLDAKQELQDVTQQLKSAHLSLANLRDSHAALEHQVGTMSAEREASLDRLKTGALRDLDRRCALVEQRIKQQNQWRDETDQQLAKRTNQIGALEEMIVQKMSEIETSLLDIVKLKQFNERLSAKLSTVQANNVTTEAKVGDMKHEVELSQQELRTLISQESTKREDSTSGLKTCLEEKFEEFAKRTEEFEKELKRSKYDAAMLAYCRYILGIHFWS
eukprot:16268_1